MQFLTRQGMRLLPDRASTGRDCGRALSTTVSERRSYDKIPLGSSRTPNALKAFDLDIYPLVDVD
jgi:hypothetical protein